MPYNSVANSFQTKKLCSRRSSSEVRFYSEVGRRTMIILGSLEGLSGLRIGVN